MDNFLVNYLFSGNAVVLVGSGPSTAMGYPSWATLASKAIARAKSETSTGSYTKADNHFLRKNYPAVFDELETIIGLPRLRQILDEVCRPSEHKAKIYELICKWPVKTYLTTNFDDEIQKHLSALGETYLAYNNTEDHLAHLTPDISGTIFKLHGDFRSDSGLVLTSTQYQEISNGTNWDYWRTKMTSVFQMLPVVIIGHSLTDENVKHVLASAKKGSGVTTPVCWIAPDVPPSQRREFLEKFRIRVISYDNRDGSHKNLVSLIENISNFVPPRSKYHASQQISSVSKLPLGDNAAAPGYFVFNNLCTHDSFDDKRLHIIISAILAGVKKFGDNKFAIEEVLEAAGWPSGHKLDKFTLGKVATKCIEDDILTQDDEKYKVGSKCSNHLESLNRGFIHLKSRFVTSLRLRTRKKFPSISESDAEHIANSIEASLTGFFREGGLTLSSIIFSNNGKTPTLPISILKFINEACTKYDDQLSRQAFFSTAIDIFHSPESSERDYLGRISQGFFAFHALGVFGEAALDRYKNASQTVWLFDSCLQIPALAIGHPANPVFVDSIRRLKSMGIRFFSTDRLFDETREHFWFANSIVERNGAQSQDVLSAATGQPPYRKSNVFLEGFINWQSIGNPSDWTAYCFALFGCIKPGASEIKVALEKLGVEIISFQDWPGFDQQDFVKRDTYSAKIVDIREDKIKSDDPSYDAKKKSMPESEALVIVLNERNGTYYMLSDPTEKSSSWFISGTSILNLIASNITGETTSITWQPEAFLNFASTISPPQSAQAADQAFNVLLWSVAESGISLIDEDKISEVFKGIIDQAKLNVEHQSQLYNETLKQKYGESAEAILARLPGSSRPLAATQFAYEIAEKEAARAERAEKIASEETKKAKVAEKQLVELKRFEKKLSTKKAKAKKQRRKSKK